jgi:hypothetical protein
MSQLRVPPRYAIFSFAARANLGQSHGEFREYLLVHEGWECEVANLNKGATERE